MRSDLKPRPRRPRLTLDYDLPDGWRRVTDIYGFRFHENRQRDGSWNRCSNRDLCRECVREDSMKTTNDRLREALVDHFGYAHMASIAGDADLFGDVSQAEAGRKLGDHIDRIEMLCCVDTEFDIHMPERFLEGPVRLDDLVAIVDTLVATRRASPH